MEMLLFAVPGEDLESVRRIIICNQLEVLSTTYSDLATCSCTPNSTLTDKGVLVEAEAPINPPPRTTYKTSHLASAHLRFANTSWRKYVFLKTIRYLTYV